MKPVFPVLLLASVLLTGCFATQHSRNYTLSAEANESHRLVADSRRIEVIGVRIPEVWDRAQIVMTKSAREVQLSEFHRWAAPLKADLPQVVVQNLVRILDNPKIWLRADFVGPRPDLRVQIAIERMDARIGEDFRLDATWVIVPPGGASDRNIGRATFTEPVSGNTHEAIVASMSKALLALSQAVAKDIAAVPLK